jgi:phage head maturation protease
MAGTTTETRMLYRHLRATVQTPSQGRVVALFNAPTVDQHNTVILPQGCDHSHYMTAGRSVTWEHGLDAVRGGIPVAKTESIRQSKQGLIGEFQFREDPFSQSVFEAYKDGSARGFSVEFLPRKGGYGRPTAEELRSHPEWKGVTEVHRNWLLRGISATVIPSNPDTLTLEVRSLDSIPDPVERAVLMARGQMEEWVASLSKRQLEMAMEFVRAMKVPLSKPGPNFFRGPSEADKSRRLEGGPSSYDYWKSRTS